MMLTCFVKAKGQKQSVPIIPVTPKQFKGLLKKLSKKDQCSLSIFDFKGEADTYAITITESGVLDKVFVGLGDNYNVHVFNLLPLQLPEAVYHFSDDFKPDLFRKALINWGLGSYQFVRYKRAKRSCAKIIFPSGCDAQEIESLVSSIYWIRDMIHTPTADMSTENLAEESQALAKRYHMQVKQVIGKQLIKQHYYGIYAVGRASSHPPRLIDLRWGKASAPKVTLVGKGVCFDSGGLNLKSTSQMEKMKKDMGGAAYALGLAKVMVEAKLPIRLRVLIPAVENMVAGNAYKPGEIIRMRNGKTIEVTNTDAEGRIILADALYEAASEKPDILIDFATLTGAARTALGPDIAVLFCNQDLLAEALLQSAKAEDDAVWRMPLYAPYRDMLKSTLADYVNSTNSPYAGAITAALFLEEFIDKTTAWVHFDVMGAAGVQGIQAVFHYLKYGLCGKKKDIH